MVVNIYIEHIVILLIRTNVWGVRKQAKQNTSVSKSLFVSTFIITRKKLFEQ